MDTGIYRIMQAKMGLEGLEPPTYCLEGSCSIQMSYNPKNVSRISVYVNLCQAR